MPNYHVGCRPIYLLKVKPASAPLQLGGHGHDFTEADFAADDPEFGQIQMGA